MIDAVPARTPLSFLLAFGLFAAVFVPLAVASDDESPAEDSRGRPLERGNSRDNESARENRTDRHHGEDDEVDEDERDVRMASGHGKFEVELSRRAAQRDDRVRMDFNSPDARFRLQFEGRENDSHSHMKLDAHFDAVFEFRDANGNGRYDPGEDVPSAWSLGDQGNDEVRTDESATWDEAVIEDIVVDGQAGKKITADAHLGGSGVFELRFFVFGDFVDLENSTLRPTAVKIDIEIRDYPFVASDTRLGVLLETRAKDKFHWSHAHEDIADDEEGVVATQDVDGKPVSLVFTWKETATVDGVDTAVGSTALRTRTVVENGTEGSEFQRRESFALSYERGSLVVHDPEAFVSIQSLTSALPIGNALLVLVGAAATAGLVVFTIAPRMRRRE